MVCGGVRLKQPTWEAGGDGEGGAEGALRERADVPELDAYVGECAFTHASTCLLASVGWLHQVRKQLVGEADPATGLPGNAWDNRWRNA